MLDPSNGRRGYAAELSVPQPEESSPAELIEAGVGIIKRNIMVVLVLGLLGSILGIGVFLTSTKEFTATTTVLINTHKIELLQQPTVYNELPLQAIGAVESQMELLRSDEVALRVIKKLNLMDDKTFVGGSRPGSIRSFIHKFIPSISSRDLSEEDRQNLALNVFKKNLAVERIGVTYAITINFRFVDAGLAANIANALADEFIDFQRSLEYVSARRASEWLEQRLPVLRAKNEAAQSAVVSYKQEHNLVETTGGQLIEDQRLADINLKIGAARDEALRAKARANQFAALSGTGLFSPPSRSSTGVAAEPDSLDKLRNEYFDITSKLAEASGKFGANNPAIVGLRNQEIQLHSQIAEEIQRLREAADGDYQAAQVRVAALTKDFDEAVAQARAAKEAGVKLHELEATARTYQDMYTSLISRYNASLQQEISPVAEATVISLATPLLQRDYKTTIRNAAIFPAIGVLLGLGIALLREILAARGFLTSKSVLARLEIQCIGLLPYVRTVQRRSRSARDGEVKAEYGVARTVVEQPSSEFAQGVRSIRFAIDQENRSRSTKVVGITSTIANEGKSTVALAVAQLIASSGASVILVDWDLKDPSLTGAITSTRAITSTAKAGTGGLALGKLSLNKLVYTDPVTDVAFIPAISDQAAWDEQSRFSSAEPKVLFDTLRQQYQYVIVNMPPLVRTIDVCEVGAVVDALVLVVEWNRTRIDVVKRALRSVSSISNSIIGVVLNKCDMKLLSTYDPYVTSYGFEKSSAG